MAVPTIFTDISATAASNSPSGSETVGSGLDDYIRGYGAAIRGGLAHKGADIASATNMDLGAVAGSFHDITGTTTIETFGTVSAGIHKVLQFDSALTLTHNTPLILPGAVNITTAAGDIGWFISEGSGNWRCLFFSKAVSSWSLRNIQVYTSSDTWTKPANCKAVLAKVWGSGGGGGGAKSSNSVGAIASSGGGGGYAEEFILSAALGATETVTVGAGGTAGAATPTSGGTGGTSSFGVHCQATGGTGGTLASETGGAAVTAAYGAAGGVGSGGDINLTGQRGRLIEGGASHMAQPVFRTAVNTAGVAGDAPGGGGSGADSQDASGKAGGVGGAGQVIVWEFY